MNASYGFSLSDAEKQSDRRARGTDYAACQALWIQNAGSDQGYSYWWLRTVGHWSNFAYTVNDGGAANESDIVNQTDTGIRPACRLTNLVSDSRQSDYLPSADVSEHAPNPAVIENEISHSCTEAGSYDEVAFCFTCGDELSRKTTPVPALGHIDENNDGRCDRTVCSVMMTGGDHCPRCGKIHNGGLFDRIAGFFHRIFYAISRLFVIA